MNRSDKIKMAWVIALTAGMGFIVTDAVLKQPVAAVAQSIHCAALGQQIKDLMAEMDAGDGSVDNGFPSSARPRHTTPERNPASSPQNMEPAEKATQLLKKGIDEGSGTQDPLLTAKLLDAEALMADVERKFERFKQTDAALGIHE